MENEDAPEDINIHKRIWGKNADQVAYDMVGGKEGKNDHFEEERCPFVIPELTNLDTAHAAVPQNSLVSKSNKVTS